MHSVAWMLVHIELASEYDIFPVECSSSMTAFAEILGVLTGGAFTPVIVIIVFDCIKISFNKLQSLSSLVTALGKKLHMQEDAPVRDHCPDGHDLQLCGR